MHKEINLEKLNKEQREAVTHTGGPLLIVAGAGTGKTTVITQRIAWLIEQKKAKTEEILAVTFTHKASDEMEERVDRLLSLGYTDLWISTFHGFCERVLKDNAIDIGLPLDFKLLDDTASWMLVRQNLEKFNLDYYRPLGNPTKFIHILIKHFSNCKDQAIYPEDYLKHADDLKTNLTDLKESTETERLKEVASAYHTYQKLLLDNNALDFGDLINYCLKLFQKRPKILEKYRDKFKYILVDEFQDTNLAQYELIKILSAPKNNLTVCADDFQAIYRFRGASFTNILKFRKDFSKAKEVALIENYRSTQNILDLSYKFIQANDKAQLEGIDKKLVASKKEKGIIEHLHFSTLSQEASGVVNRIIDIHSKEKEITYSDFTILVRANNHAMPFVRELERKGVPYQFLASKGLYSKPVVLDVISYLKLLDDYHESSACYRVLNMPFLGILTNDMMLISLYSKKKSYSIYEVLQELSLIQGISENAKEKIHFVLTLIKKHTELAKQNNVSEVFVAFLRDSGYLKYLTDNEQKENIDLLTQFHKKIKGFEEESLTADLKSFMEELDMELESNEQGKLEFDIEQGPDMVRIMTIHSAKGLEFNYVFLVNMVDKRFPSTSRKDPIEIPDELVKDIKPEGDVHIQEERRLAYVAMTRAKHGLFFASASDYGGVRKKKLSRFLSEMGFKPILSGKQSKELSAEKIEIVKEEEQLILPEHFSYSQLSNFSKCPLMYKFSNILKIPTKGKPMFSFGTTIHNTLYEFLKKQNQPEIIEQEDLFGFDNNITTNTDGLSYKDLEEVYEQEWVDEWFESKAQKERYRKLGKKLIKELYDKFTVEPPNILKIDDALALEIWFNLKIGGNLLKGRIDRIDEVEGGVKVVDYKTGKSKDKLDADGKQQLLLYQIAVEEVYGLKPVEMAYYYVEADKELSFLGTEKEKQDQKQKITEQIEKIKKSDFTPTPGFHCQYCDFKDICNFAQK
ncbi:MAG: UvrD-helicase domain-containing protein [Parcubacteria group bacterium]|nr:UvrD-helicase domain-containing protein [Parcubacteria group bacterium]